MKGPKPEMDVGLILGPKGGVDADPTGPDESFKDLANIVLDDKADRAARVDALHELIRQCMSEGSSGDDIGESDEAGGGY